MTTTHRQITATEVALPRPRPSSDLTDDALVSRLLVAQRRVSHFLQDLVDGWAGWELRLAVLAEVAEIIDGVAAIVAADLPRPVLATTDPQRTDSAWRPALALLAASPARSPLLDPRTVALRIRGTDEHLVAQAGRRLSPLDVFLLEPLAEVLAALRQRELVEVRARVREREDAQTGLPNGFALDEQLARLERRRPSGTSTVTLLHVRLLDREFRAVLGDGLMSVAGAVRAAVREQDMVAHLGGATFAVLCDGIAEDEVAAVATRIRDHLDAALAGNDRLLTVDVAVVPASTGPDDSAATA